MLKSLSHLSISSLILPILILSCHSSFENISPDPSNQQDLNHLNTKYSNSNLEIYSSNPCPDSMVEIIGDYCPDLEEVCLKYADPDNSGANGPVQCLEFKYPTKCRSNNRIHLHYCIDRYPLPNIPGELPTTQLSWFEAKDLCEKSGKRLCSKKEFTQACRGPENKPYPYGDGYHRDSDACNIDRSPWLDPNTHSFQELDKRIPLGSKPKCKSDYQVYDMVGNNDRWVYNESEKPFRSALMGGHALPGRNRCTPATLAHNESFKYYVTGAVCCRDVDSK